MSRESSAWLNQNTLIGFTDKRGKAWHYRASDQGAEPNHYPGEIPVDDVLRRLFSWEAVELPLQAVLHTPDGPVTIELPDRKAIARSDTLHVMGIFKDGYHPHQYREWLINQVANIVDKSQGELGIGSAGLLKAGAQAWVQIEMPENEQAAGGFEFRPNLIACTSFDGSLATTYKRTKTVAVCDNTMAMALSEKGQQFKARHSKNSGMKLADVRVALQVVHTMAEDFRAEVESLLAWEVEDRKWSDFLAAYAPTDPTTVIDGKVISKRTITMNENKQDVLNTLYRHDERAAPWSGTALGVLQATNTYQHHYVTRRSTNGHGVVRAERNMEDVLSGTMAASDANTLKVLAGVTGHSL